MAKAEFMITADLRYINGTTGTFGSTGTRYLHLWTVEPAADGTGGTAVTGGAYAPVQIGGTTGAFAAISTGVTSIANDIIIQYTTKTTAAWGDVVAHTVHISTSTSSSMLWGEALDNTVTISSGTNVSYAVGGLVIKEV